MHEISARNLFEVFQISFVIVTGASTFENWKPKLIGLHAASLGTYIMQGVILNIMLYIVSWEAEGRYHYSKMFHWEPEGR